MAGAIQPDEPRLSFSAFLLRPDQVQKFEAALVTGKGGLELAPPLAGVFVPLPSTPAEPGWLTIVQRLLVAPGSLTLQSQSPAGLMFVRHAGKHFVLTFGHAWQRLEGEWLERDFGRRVALNSIARNKIVAIRAEQVFAKWHLASERAPRASSVDEFGVEFDRDLVSAVEGIPGDDLLGKSIRGATSLRAQLPLSGLAAALDRAADLFDSDAYKQTWPELDNMGPVKDSVLIAQLEMQLNAEFASGTAQRRLNLFTPDQRREENAVPDSYVFGRLSKTPAMSPYLLVDGWLNYLQKAELTPSVDVAKQTRVHLMDEAKEEVRSHPIFECFGYELMLNGKQYILSSGVWYEVVDLFLRRINQDIGRIAAPAINLPAWNQTESEGEYNKGCAVLPGFLHFDAKNILFGGGQSKFEFCDVFHPRSKTLIFAKIASKSAGMSHLVEQVRRTAELLFSTDPAYRKELAKVFRKYHPTADRTWLDSRPRNGEWKLCLVSLGKPARKLPFFAKCALVRLDRDLRERGHEVSFTDV
jgi:uncharacterized protein (TIGR04141 family)